MKLHALSARQILEIFDSDPGLPPLSRTSLVLGLATDAETGALDQLTLGQRQALLLGLRRMMFGPTISATPQCPHCGEALEVDLDITAIEALGAGAQGVRPFAIGEWNGRFRLLDRTDLQAAAEMETMTAARAELLRRCVVEARRDAIAVDPGDLPEATIDELGELVAQAAPLADLVLNLACGRCGHAWLAALDIGIFLLAEITAAANHVLFEVGPPAHLSEHGALDRGGLV